MLAKTCLNIPEVFQKIIENGHVVGNHTYNHLQGMKTKNYAFFKNIEKADKLINSNLFRPPHGWLSRGTIQVFIAQV